MKDILTNLAILAATAILAALFFLAFAEGLNRHEQAECLGWQENAREFEGFYLTKAERMQCDHWGIEVDAPTK